MPVRHDILEAAGCVHVEFDSQGNQKELYDVIQLSTIVCRHYVVPSFRKKDSFYVSCFSPTRPV